VPDAVKAWAKFCDPDPKDGHKVCIVRKLAFENTSIMGSFLLRIDSAKHQLESAQRSVHEISRRIGYEDVAFFRQLFRRYTGTSPREYRARFGPTP